MYTSVMAESALELASIPWECMQGHESWQWLLPPWSEAGLILTWLYFFNAYILTLEKAASSLVGSHARVRVARAGGCGGPSKPTRSPHSFQSAASTLLQGVISYIWNLERCNDNFLCKTAKETQMYRTVFWTLWKRERVGWFGGMSWKHV